MKPPYINRELSWLEFNQRVLNEALRPDLPILDRVKFLAITGSNLDEFFQVRIGGLHALQASAPSVRDISGMDVGEQLAPSSGSVASKKTRSGSSKKSSFPPWPERGSCSIRSPISIPSNSPTSPSTSKTTSPPFSLHFSSPRRTRDRLSLHSTFASPSISLIRLRQKTGSSFCLSRPQFLAFPLSMEAALSCWKLS